MFFNCQHQKKEYNKYLCKKKNYLSGDNIQINFADITLIAREDFEFYKQNLTFNFKNAYYFYMTINSGSYGYTSFGSNITMNDNYVDMIKIGMPDSEQNQLWDKYINMFLNKYEVNYIYWDPNEEYLNITFINNTIKTFNYNYSEFIINLIEEDTLRILNSSEIILSYYCTSCFENIEFKLENLWIVGLGLITFTFTLYNIINFILSKKEKENINLIND